MSIPNEVKVNMKKALQLIMKADRIFMTTHEGTDGDDLGSLLAVRLGLNKLNKKTVVAIKKGVPDYLSFLPTSNEVKDKLTDTKFDLIITFGCNEIKRTNLPELYNLNVPIINIDHHPDNKLFGTINIVEPSTSSVAELMYYFYQVNDLVMDKDIATCILTGIFTDTGGFKHANTTAETLIVAAELMKKGARVDKVSKLLDGSSNPARYRIWARALENTRLDKLKGVAYSVLTEKDFLDVNATDDDLAGTIFVQFLNSIPEARYALLLRQDGEMVRGNLRSSIEKGVDVNKIAATFGGGGHKLASGFKIKGKLVKDKDGWKIQRL